MELNKSEIQKLINTKSESLTYENVNGKSEVWKQFVRVKVDDGAVNYVRCSRCSSALKWHSHDGTSSLKMHIDYCARKIPQTKIPDFKQQRPLFTTKKIPASVKSDVADVLLLMCAKDIRCVCL